MANPFALMYALTLTLLLSAPTLTLGANPNQAIQSDVLNNIGDETPDVEEPSGSANTNYSANPAMGLPMNHATDDWRFDQGTETHFLDAGGEKTLALFKQDTTGTPAGALLIIHDLGHNPDWPGPIRRLRRQLPNYGWSTLSIQADHNKAPRTPNTMTAKADATPAEQNAQANKMRLEKSRKALGLRIRSAFKFLNRQGLYNIVVVAQGTHARFAVTILKDVPTSSIAGFITLNITHDNDQRLEEIATQMSKITAPILDLVPELGHQHEFARFRITKTNQNLKKNYQQYTIPSANHAFAGAEDFLVKRIRGWLKTNAGGMQAILKSPQ